MIIFFTTRGTKKFYVQNIKKHTGKNADVSRNVTPEGFKPPTLRAEI